MSEQMKEGLSSRNESKWVGTITIMDHEVGYICCPYIPILTIRVFSEKTNLEEAYDRAMKCILE